MKKLLSGLICLAALLGLPGARAQVTYSTAAPVAGLNGGTNRVLALSTNSYTAWNAGTNFINCARQSVVTIELRGAEAAAAGSPNPEVLRFYLDRSLDKISWVPYTNLSLTMNGTTPVANLYDVYVGGAGWLRVNQVGCTNSVAGTNLFADYALKTGL